MCYIFIKALHSDLQLECYKNYPTSLKDVMDKVLALEAYYIDHNLLKYDCNIDSFESHAMIDLPRL